mgnify:CR=1 FL=1
MIASSAIKFFYSHTAPRDWSTLQRLRVRKEKKLPDVLSMTGAQVDQLRDKIDDARDDRESADYKGNFAGNRKMRRWAALSTIGDDGYPQVTLIWFLHDPDDDTIKLFGLALATAVSIVALADEVCEQGGVAPEDVYEVALAGNAIPAPDERCDAISDALAAAGFAHGRAATTGLDQSLTVVPVAVRTGEPSARAMFALASADLPYASAICSASSGLALARSNRCR